MSLSSGFGFRGPSASVEMPATRATSVAQPTAAEIFAKLQEYRQTAGYTAAQPNKIAAKANAATSKANAAKVRAFKRSNQIPVKTMNAATKDRLRAGAERARVRNADVNDYKAGEIMAKYGWNYPPGYGYQQPVDHYGKNVSRASDEQLVNRIVDGWSGRGAYGYDQRRGLYAIPPGHVPRSAVHGDVGQVQHGRGIDGQGGFWDDLWNGVKSVGRVFIPAGLDAVAPGAGRIAAGLLGSGAYDDNTDNFIDANGQPLDMSAPLPKTDRTDIVQAPDGMGLRVRNSENVQYNNLVNPGAHSTRTNATIRSVGDETGDLVFSHNEYLKDITSLGPQFHTMERLEINPGLVKSFPVLSSFAALFEEYDFVQLVFHFKSLVTEGNASAAGSVMLCPNYNPANSDLQDKRQIENVSGSVSDKVTSDLVCGIECDNNKVAYGGLKYVRKVDVDPIGRRMYDVGFLQIASQGVPAGLPIGELWCSYQIRLSKMRIDQQVPMGIGDGWSRSVTAAGISGGGTSVSLNVMKSLDSHQQAAGANNLDFDNGGVGLKITNISSGINVPTVEAHNSQATRRCAGGFSFNVACIGGSGFVVTFNIPMYMATDTVSFQGLPQNEKLPWLRNRLASYPDKPKIILDNMFCTVPITMGLQVNDFAPCVHAITTGNGYLFPVTWHGSINFTLTQPGQQGIMSGDVRLEVPPLFLNTVSKTDLGDSLLFDKLFFSPRSDVGYVAPCSMALLRTA